MSTQTLLRSFAGGEIAPELFGRLDLTKFQTGLQKAVNFIIAAHGPAVNRAGLPYVIETKDSTKRAVLLPFIYDETQAYVLELGNQYLRIHTEGGTVLEAAQNITGISRANPGVLTYAGADPTNGQWFYLAAISGMTELNGRYVKVANVNAGANTFELTDLAGNNINTSAYSAYTSGGTMARVYEVSTPYLEAHLYDLHFTQSNDVMTIVHPSYQQRQLARLGAASWALNTLSFSPTIGTPAAPTLATGGPGGGTPVNNVYVTTAIAAETLEESIASASATQAYDLTVAGNYIDVTSAAVSGAVRYNIYKLKNGLYGYIGQTDGSALRDNNITPDVSKTPPIANDPFVGANNYPAAVGYWKGRRAFGGTNTKKLNQWFTKAGTESNLSYSIPTRDDDSITIRLTARQAGQIRHIVPLNDLIVLTSNSGWRIGTLNADALTPTSIDPNPIGDHIGASNVPPLVTSSAILHPQARGGRVREIKYKWDSQGYISEDISIMAPHLFDGYTIVQAAYSHAPYKVAWFVRSDGVLLGLTYVPEHQVAAWHQHRTDGYFESIAVIPEGGEDVLYCIVRRTDGNGRTVRNVEYLHTRVFDRLQEGFFVDSGLTLNNTVAATLTPGAGADVVDTEDVIFTAGSAIFSASDVDRHIHYDYEETVEDENGTSVVYRRASALITEYTDTTHVKATIEYPWPGTTVIASGGWRMTVTRVTGAWHLAGLTVSVLGDGAVYPQAVVDTEGRIDLEEPASIVHIGRPYNADLQTLPLSLEAKAFGQAIQKNVNRVGVRANATSGIKAGPAFTKLTEIKQRTDERYGEPPRTISGVRDVVITSTWGFDTPVCIRQENPLPATISALIPDSAYGG